MAARLLRAFLQNFLYRTKPRAGKTRFCRWLWGFGCRLRPDSVRAEWRAPVAAGWGGGSAELGGDFHVARWRLEGVAERSIVLWTYTAVAGREPAVRAIVLAGMDLRDRHHGLSTPRPWIGGARGWLPRSKVSMTIMRPPQHEQARALTGGSSGSTVWSASAAASGAGMASNWRARARFSVRPPLANKP